MKKETPWLNEADLNDWVEVIDYEGETIGWARNRDLKRLNVRTRTIQTPKRFMLDPYVLYHSKLAYERGIFSKSEDLSEVQVVLLASNIVKTRETEETLRKRALEENMLINNPEMFKVYQKQQEEERLIKTETVQEKVPTNMEELIAMLSDGNEGDESSEEIDGWLASYLSDEDLETMGDD